MLNINLLYLYPETIEINNEMNLLRIVDREQKESLVFYYVRENEIYKIYMINTFTGENTYLISCAEENNIKLSGTFRNLYLEGPPQHKDKSKFITQIIAIVE